MGGSSGKHKVPDKKEGKSSDEDDTDVKMLVPIYKFPLCWSVDDFDSYVKLRKSMVSEKTSHKREDGNEGGTLLYEFQFTPKVDDDDANSNSRDEKMKKIDVDMKKKDDEDNNQDADEKKKWYLRIGLIGDDISIQARGPSPPSNNGSMKIKWASIDVDVEKPGEKGTTWSRIGDIHDFTKVPTFGWLKWDSIENLKRVGVLPHHTSGLVMHIQLKFYGEPYRGESRGIWKDDDANLEKLWPVLRSLGRHDVIFIVHEEEEKSSPSEGDGGEPKAKIPKLIPNPKKTTTLKAHKAVLSVRSPVFATMFQPKDGKCPCPTPEEIEINDMSPKTLNIMLDFIYTGKLLVNPIDWEDIAGELATAAHKYQIKGLLLFMNQHLSSVANPKNAILLYHFAKRHQLKTAMEQILEFIREHLDDVIDHYELPDATTPKGNGDGED